MNDEMHVNNNDVTHVVPTDDLDPENDLEEHDENDDGGGSVFSSSSSSSSTIAMEDVKHSEDACHGAFGFRATTTEPMHDNGSVSKHDRPYFR